MKKNRLRLYTVMLFFFVCLISISAGNKATETPSIGINHVFIFLDSETYKAIESSDFIRKQFAVFEKRTTVRADTSYTGIYFYGTQTYFEFLDAGSQMLGSPGFSGIAWGVDNRGDLEKLKTALGETFRVSISGEISRALQDKQIPWFRNLMIDAFLGTRLLTSWIMEYSPNFLKEWHAELPPQNPSISRKEVLERYAASLGIDPLERYFSELTGITVAVSAKTFAGAQQFCDLLGYQRTEKDHTLILKGPEWTIHLIPETESASGIQNFHLRVRGTPDQKEYRFGAKSVLKFIDDSTAVWTF